MTIHLHGGDETNAGFYSGLLVSAYAVAEAFTAVGWGILSDRVGRKPVVLVGLGGVALSCLIFGFAQSYWVALLARFIGGALNGNVSVMQTMVAEMVKHPEHEPVAYAVQPFVWTLGSIVGAALGGFLAKPTKPYPGLFPPDGLFGQYPFLLPNLASIAVIVLAILQGIIFLEETNPRARARNQTNQATRDERTPLLSERVAPRASSVARSSFGEERPLFIEEGLPAPGQQTFDLRRNSFGTMHSIELPRNAKDGHPHLARPHLEAASEVLEYKGPVWTRTIVMLIMALVLIAYHQMAAGTLLPIHLQGRPAKPYGQLDLIGGFGMSLPDVSVYLMVNGFLSLFVQGFIFPTFVSRVGVWYSFLSTIILYPTAYLIIPFLSAVPRLTSAGIYLSLILQAFYGIISVPSALILLKDATPSPLVLGRVNGLAMSACCAARTVSPPLVGLLYNTGGSASAWLSCAAVGVVGALQLFWVPRHPVDVSIGRPVIGPVIEEEEDEFRGRPMAAELA